MIIELSQLVRRIDPRRTVLFFGSGSSVPSGLKSAPQLTQALCDKFKVGEGSEYSLTEASQIVEDQHGRRALIDFLRREMASARPAGGVLNLPLYGWNSIYTTNYDQIVEKSYSSRSAPLRVLSSNFDFGSGRDDDATSLFKVHGSIERDIVDGHLSRIIITDGDYDLTSDYRKMIWDRLSADMADNDCVIIGYSLLDHHVRELVLKVAEMKREAQHTTKVYLLLYTVDLNRASLIERKGVDVCFAGIDSFFELLAAADAPVRASDAGPEQVFADLHALYPVTTVVSDAITKPTTVERMYEGWPASWSDVDAGLTFQRDVAVAAAAKIAAFEQVFAVILGASGTGKTTAARRVVLELAQAGYLAWEHNSDRQLLVTEWIEVAKRLQSDEKFGVLFVDNAHDHLYEINKIADALVSAELTNFQVVLASPRHDWNPRVKSPNLYKYGKEYHLSELSDAEVDRLIQLVETEPRVANLVENTFGNFSKAEKRRRLRQNCNKNTFVCMRNIFDNDSFDHIILREFASLSPSLQEIYRVVSALESFNVKVHRQLVIRLTGVAPQSIMAALDGLTDIVEEYSVDEKKGVYGWRGRHKVITEIITKYKFNEQGAIYKLIERVIDCLSMTYDLEVRTVRNLCSGTGGISKAGTKEQQNKLLQRIISQAPGERIPRHRLISNLISLGQIAKAETEIRIFENDFREDGPVARYRVKLLLYRALKSTGLLEEDRKTILSEAVALAKKNISRFPLNKYVLASYCDTGLASLKLTGSFAVFDSAMTLLKEAETKLGDPDISRQIERYTRAITMQQADVDVIDLVVEEI